MNVMEINYNLCSQIARAMAVLSRHCVKSYKEDLFYDMPTTIGNLHHGITLTLFLRDSGSYSLDVYKQCSGKDSPTWNDAVDYAKRSLGVEWIVTFATDENNDLILTIRGEVDELSYSLKNDLACFNTKYEYIKGLYK